MEKDAESRLFEKINEWLSFCEQFEALLAGEPSIDDLGALQDWYKSVHASLATLAHMSAQAEAAFAASYAKLIESQSISQEAFKVVRGSTTMTDRYAAGKLPRLTFARERINRLMRVVEVMLDDLRTLIATYREQQKREAMVMPRNTQSV